MKKTLLWSSIGNVLGDKGFTENKTQFVGEYIKQINLKDYLLYYYDNYLAILYDCT